MPGATEEVSLATYLFRFCSRSTAPRITMPLRNIKENCNKNHDNNDPGYTREDLNGDSAHIVGNNHENGRICQNASLQDQLISFFKLILLTI